jgi:ribosomal subunit interface protein
MKFTLKGTQLDVTPSLKTYLAQKVIEPLEKRLAEFPKKEAVAISIELSRETKHHSKGDVFRAEITISLPPKRMIRIEEKATDIRAAIDLLEQSMTRELELYKEKTKMRVRREARKHKHDLY